MCIYTYIHILFKALEPCEDGLTEDSQASPSPRGGPAEKGDLTDR